jgi:hypothetical protein
MSVKSVGPRVFPDSPEEQRGPPPPRFQFRLRISARRFQNLVAWHVAPQCHPWISPLSLYFFLRRASRDASGSDGIHSWREIARYTANSRFHLSWSALMYITTFGVNAPFLLNALKNRRWVWVLWILTAVILLLRKCSVSIFSPPSSCLHPHMVTHLLRLWRCDFIKVPVFAYEKNGVFENIVDMLWVNIFSLVKQIFSKCIFSLYVYVTLRDFRLQ